jgi:hypothetical protein
MLNYSENMLKLSQIYLVSSLFLLLFTSFALADVSVILNVFGPGEITINSPTNTTYTLFKQDSLDFNFVVYDSSLSDFRVRAYLDGQQQYNNPHYTNGTTISGVTTSNIGVGTHNFTVVANDTYSKSVSFYVIAPPVRAFINVMIPAIMGGGFILAILGLFIGSPQNPKELIDYAIIVVIVGFLLAAGLNLIVGIL